MRAATFLRHARRRAGLTQRQLAARSGVPQATIARIETSCSEPRFALLQRLLWECGQQLASEDLCGQGIDRTLIRQRLALSPQERFEPAAAEARSLAAFEEAIRPGYTSAMGSPARDSARSGSEVDPVIEVYKADVDRTLLRDSMRKSPEERLDDLQRLHDFALELGRAGRSLEAG